MSPTDLQISTELDAILESLRLLDAPNLELACRPEPLGGGFWAEMWTLDLTDHGPHLPHRIVLRLVPDAGLGAWETEVQRAVADQGFPTPRILAAGPEAQTRRAWSAMDHATGQPLLSGLSGVSALARLPRLARLLPSQLATMMATLHRLDPAPIRATLVDDSTPNGLPIGTAALLETFTHRARRLGDDRLLGVVASLASATPPQARSVICHGDLHPFNILDDAGQLSVLDWTAAQLAEPAYDVAFTALLLASPPLTAPRALRPPIDKAAHYLSRRFVRSYRAVADNEVSDEQLSWYTRFHATRVALDLATWRADGTLDQQAGHPWITLEPTITTMIASH